MWFEIVIVNFLPQQNHKVLGLTLHSWSWKQQLKKLWNMVESELEIRLLFLRSRLNFQAQLLSQYGWKVFTLPRNGKKKKLKLSPFILGKIPMLKKIVWHNWKLQYTNHKFKSSNLFDLDLIYIIVNQHTYTPIQNTH